MTKTTAEIVETIDKVRRELAVEFQRTENLITFMTKTVPGQVKENAR